MMPDPEKKTAGVYDNLPAAEYHSDPCHVPSLSASIASTLLSRSPRHAWLKHPRLNPNWQPEERAAFDIGKAAHALLLEGETVVEVIDAKDWRTNDAKDKRAEAYAASKVPLLAAQWAEVKAMVDAVRPQLDQFQEPEVRAALRPENGKSERTMIWREGEAWCRIRPDWTDNECTQIWDYKTTSASANPEAWGGRTLFNLGADFRAAFYRRGVMVLHPKVMSPVYRFIV
ncbi:MAG: PD-(D/E)XK nuclease-like domain-containing protein, partial [Verrucomicrobiota bacterium]